MARRDVEAIALGSRLAGGKQPGAQYYLAALGGTSSTSRRCLDFLVSQFRCRSLDRLVELVIVSIIFGLPRFEPKCGHFDSVCVSVVGSSWIFGFLEDVLRCALWQCCRDHYSF